MTSKIQAKRFRPERSGFTLIELLVVISIIALLISVLLPSLSSARRMGQRGACLATLRDIGKGMQEYAMDNDDWIVGSPDGSGAYLSTEAKGWGPAFQTWDWMGPLAEMMGLGLIKPSKGAPNEAIEKRFNDLRSSGAFLCAGNKFLSPRYSAMQCDLDAGAGWLVSYNTQRLQLLTEASWLGSGPMGLAYLPPSGWKPLAGKIGPPAEKIFCGDGARYSTCSIEPDYDICVDASAGGSDCDAGAMTGWSRSWDRCAAPGNGGAPGDHVAGTDARIYAYRHSTGIPPKGAPGNAFKASFVFYDGHVDTLGDLDSSSPYLWLPSGTRIFPSTSELWPDTMGHFGLGNQVDIGQTYK
ncbi:MAG TPA: type II secretion system protein [Phycisphaerae bacterium]|nr:type II secretion system protein [Phycisphaerae bacterium]